MALSYTIDGVAKHMLTMDWPYPHAGDGEVNFKALYEAVRKVFPSLTSHDFSEAFDRCLDMRQAASNRSSR